MARTDRTPRDETAESAGVFPPQPRQYGQEVVPDQDGGPMAASEEDRDIAADMLSEYGPAFRRLADL